MSNTDPGMDVAPPPGYQNPDPKMAVSPPPGYQDPDPKMAVGPSQLQRLAQAANPQQPKPLWQPSPDVNPATALQPQGQPPAPPPAEPQQPKPRPFAFQRYTPAGPRPAGQRGKPGPFTQSMDTYPGLGMTTLMPHESEAFGIAAGANRQLAATAAPGIAGLAQISSGLASTLGPFFDLLSNNAFSTAYRNRALGGIQQQEAQVRMQEAQMRMREEEMNMKRTEFMDNQARLIAAHSELLTQYDTVLAQYNSGAITKEQAESEIRQLNATHGHSYLDNTLENKGIFAVDQYIQFEDQKMHDNWNLYASLYDAAKTKAKATGDNSLDWSKSGEGGRSGLLADPDQGQQLDPQTGQPTGETATPTIETLQKRYPDLNEQGVNAALELSESGKATGITDAGGARADPKAYHAAINLSGDIDKAVSKTLNRKFSDDPTEDRADKIKALEGIDPNIAQKVKDIANYKEDLTGIDDPHTKGKFKTWAHALNPKYEELAAQGFKQYFLPNTKESMAIGAVAALAQTHIQTLQTLGQGDTPIAMNKLKAAWQALAMGGNTAGMDPKYVIIAGQLRQELIQLNQISNGTGAIRSGLLEHMMETTSPTLPASVIRETLTRDVSETYSRVAHIQGEFERYGRTEFVPGLNSHTWQIMSGIMRVDQYGQVPSDAPPELKAVGRKGPAGSLPPPTESEARGAKAYIAAHANDPNPTPDVVRNLARAQSLISSTIVDAPWEHKPDDATD